jgi:hypothetical protein
MSLALHPFRYCCSALLIGLCLQTVALSHEFRGSLDKSPSPICLARTKAGFEATVQLQEAHGLLNLNVPPVVKAADGALPMARRVELWNRSRRYRN